MREGKRNPPETVHRLPVKNPIGQKPVQLPLYRQRGAFPV
jgi:hypothetical protein